MLQEPDWSEALEREHDHANCDGHPNHYGHHHGRQQPSAFSAQPTERLSSSVQAAVLHASQAAQQAASALQTIVQEQAAAASGGSNPQQQALLATVAAATSAAAAASSAAAILLAQLQLGAGSGAATAQAVAQPASSSQAQQLHSPAHPHPHSHYHQQGLAVSAEEAHRRQERLTAECGQLCRSKGFVWLATRPDLCGEWSQVRRFLCCCCCCCFCKVSCYMDSRQRSLARLGDLTAPCLLLSCPPLRPAGRRHHAAGRGWSLVRCAAG